jgi:hypothetical protein
MQLRRLKSSEACQSAGRHSLRLLSNWCAAANDATGPQADIAGRAGRWRLSVGFIGACLSDPEDRSRAMRRSRLGSIAWAQAGGPSIPRSNDGISHVRRSQCAFEPTHTCAVISASVSRSSVPSRIRMWSGSFATRANTGDPHREQKHRRAPGEDSYSDINCSPAITRYRSSGIRALAENAVPLARRQRSQ